MNLAPIVKLVRAYDSTEWEVFIAEWQKGLQQYYAVKRLGGAGDHGRDVIGLVGADGCEGVWDNFQCKHYEGPLTVPTACEDAGKVIFHAFRKVFQPPRRCTFVAPRGPNTELRDMLLNPEKFKKEVIRSWDLRVAGRVIAGEKQPLVGKLADYVDAYDFSSFAYATVSEIEQDQDQDELSRLDVELDEELTRSFQLQETSETGYRELTFQRRNLRREYEATQDRISEIDTLQARFSLLSEHYASDERRLGSIAEAGAFFMLEDGATCPVCGAESNHQRSGEACEGNVAEIVAAATAEATELKRRTEELQLTVATLFAERETVGARARELLPELDALQESILREVPSVQTMRSQTSAVIQRKLSIQKNLDIFRRRNRFLAQRAELGVSPGYDSSTIVAQHQLDGAVLDSFSQAVEAELRAWEFPDARRVFFELQKMDVSVAGKSRSANGKGVRALLHGAFSVALMKYCRERMRAHPGFVVLDSLFITYRDPADAEDSAIASTPLKDRAFKAFSALPDSLQLIVLENVDVPDWLIGKPQCIHFTGEPKVGRVGLFPPVSKP